MISDMLTNIRRIFKIAWQTISRNKGLGLQVIFIMVIAVFTLTSLFLFRGLTNFLISEAEERVDISVYFKKDVQEDEIFRVEKELYNFSKEVKDVQYISQERAKEIFIQRHENDPLYLEALEEVGNNPFLASLNIKAESPVFYAKVSDFLTQGPFKDLIEKVSYYENERIINKLFTLISTVEKTGIFFSLFLIILIFLINFNTVKLTILSFKNEISTMRLVGASNWFIRTPFIIQGLFYGLTSILIVNIIFFSSLGFLSKGVQLWLLNFSLLNYFQTSFLTLLFWQIIFVLILCVFSSFFAVRKYLKI